MFVNSTTVTVDVFSTTRRRWFVALMLAGLVAVQPASALLCNIDHEPAATLLFPFFEVNIDECSGPTFADSTALSITNTAPFATIAHVTLWTDWQVPVIDFDVYLTGYDMQSINLSDIFCFGILPQTGSAVSPHGPFSGDPIAVPDCNNTPTSGNGPNYSNPFSAALIELLQEWFTGKQSTILGTCAGSDRGDNIARGYVTVDVTQECTLLFPRDPAYYSSGVIGFDNILLGEYQYRDSVNNEIRASAPAVHIEAAPDGFFSDDDHTFYGRYDVDDLGDRREPLPTTFAARWTLESRFWIWREATRDNSPVTCGQSPDWAPLAAPEALFFDNEENLLVVPVDAPNALSTFDYSGPSSFEGLALFRLQHDAIEYPDSVAQAWVVREQSFNGNVASYQDAASLDTACELDTTPVPVAGPSGPLPTSFVIFTDGFESGSTTFWSSVVP
ncbi:MAG: hypothetical protein AAGD38_18485 [Acidobacteriota bacterium]